MLSQFKNLENIRSYIDFYPNLVYSRKNGGMEEAGALLQILTDNANKPQPEMQADLHFKQHELKRKVGLQAATFQHPGTIVNR